MQAGNILMRGAAHAIAAAIVLAAAVPADAALITKGPTAGTEVFGYWGANPDSTFGYGRWTEEIGANPPFGTTAMNVAQVGGDLVITITTPFNVGTGDAPAQAADIAISTRQNGVYDLGIALGKQTQSPGLYAVSRWATSRDLWTSQTGYVYGGAWTNDPACLGSTNPTCGNAAYTPTRIVAGTELANPVTVSQVGDSLTIDVQGLTLDQLAILWGTADCGNDPIAGDVYIAEPGTLGLLCTGLLVVGAGAARSRRPIFRAATPAA